MLASGDSRPIPQGCDDPSQLPISTCGLADVLFTVYDDAQTESVCPPSVCSGRCILGLNDDPDDFQNDPIILRKNKGYGRDPITNCSLCLMLLTQTEGEPSPYIPNDSAVSALAANRYIEESQTGKDLKGRSVASMKQCVVEGCYRKFKRVEHLRRHENIHQQLGRVSCQFCDKEFDHSDNLRAHIKRHAQPRRVSSRTRYHEEAARLYATVRI